MSCARRGSTACMRPWMNVLPGLLVTRMLQMVGTPFHLDVFTRTMHPCTSAASFGTHTPPSDERSSQWLLGSTCPPAG